MIVSRQEVQIRFRKILNLFGFELLTVGTAVDCFYQLSHPTVPLKEGNGR